MLRARGSGALGLRSLLGEDKAGKQQRGGALVVSAASVPAPANWEEWVEKEPAYISTPVAGRYSSEDWLYNLFTLASSYMTARVMSHIVANLAIATLVWFSYAYWFPQFATFCASLTTVPHSLTAGALSLLLVFRTNSAYDRFWEVFSWKSQSSCPSFSPQQSCTRRMQFA